MLTGVLFQIGHQMLIDSPSLLPRLPNLTCTFLQKHPHPLSPNPFSIINIFQKQPGLKSLQQICNCHQPVQRSISQHFRTVLSKDNGLMLLLSKPNHPYFLPLVEHTKVGLPYAFGALLQGVFHLLQADWGIAFSPAQVGLIIGLIIRIEFVIWNLRSCGQVYNPCIIFPAQFPSRLKSFHWKANRRCSRRTGKLPIWSWGRRCQPNYWIVSRRCWKYLRYAWRWRSLSCELLRGEHLRSTITSLREIVSLPSWPIFWIALGCSWVWFWAWCHVEWGKVVDLGRAWKWCLQKWVTIPWWWRKLIWRLLKLPVFSQCISRIIIWCSHIVLWALFLAKQPTLWSHIGCHLCRAVGCHCMWTKEGGEQIIYSIGDFEWSGV